MKKDYDREFHFPADERTTAETCGCPEKATDMEKEFPEPAAFHTPYDEYAGADSVRKEDEGERHRRIKRMMLLPLVSAVAVISLVFSSFDYDPLGKDSHSAGQDNNASYTQPPAVDAQDSITTVAVHITYVPTGEAFSPDSTGDEALADARAWVVSRGGDPDTMRLIRSDTTYTGVQAGEDAAAVRTYRRDVYYEAYAAEKGDTADDAFPLLSNLEPDFAGNYAWSGEGSEEYIRFLDPGESVWTYLEMGSALAAYGSYDGSGEFVPNQVSTVPNARYDQASNTLTLENFTASVLDVNLMGNGFTIRLVGENHLDQLVVWGAYYGGSVTLTGSGSLTVNESGGAPGGIGVKLNAEGSQSCLMIDKGVTLDVYGDSAIVISATTMDKAIYYLKPLRMTGGTRASGEFVEYTAPQYDENGNYIGEGSTTLAEISEKSGVQYYDYSVAGEDGKPSTHVYISPAP